MAFAELSLSRGLFSENPLSRAVSAVRERTSSVVQSVRTHVTRENTERLLHSARTTLVQAYEYTSHHKFETTKTITKKVAPAIATNVAIKIAGGALALPVIGATAAISATREGMRIAKTTQGKNVFEVAQVMRDGYARTSAQPKAVEAQKEPTLWSKITQSKVLAPFKWYGRLERTAARSAVAHNGHTERVLAFAHGKSKAEIVAEMAGMTRYQAETMRTHAVMLRLSAEDPKMRELANNVHLASRVRLADIKATEKTAIENASRWKHMFLDRKSRIADGVNASLRRFAFKEMVVASAGVSMFVKSAKSMISSGAWYAGLSAVGFHATSPLKNLKNTFWGDTSQRIGDVARAGLAHIHEHAAQSIPTEHVASAVGMSTPSAQVVKSFHPTTEGARIAKDDLYIVRPSIHTHTAVLSSGEVKPVKVAHKMVGGAGKVQAMYAPGTPIKPPTLVEVPVATTHDAIPLVQRAPSMAQTYEVVSTHKTIPIEQGSFFSKTLFDTKALPEMAQYETAIEYYSHPGTAKSIFAILELNKKNIPEESWERMDLLMQDPKMQDASFGTFWSTYQTLYPEDAFGGLNQWTGGQEITVPVETLVRTNPIEEAKLARMEEATSGGGKVRGLAQYAPRRVSDQKPPTDGIVLKAEPSQGGIEQYQQVRPPGSTGISQNISQDTYQTIAPPGGTNTTQGVVDGYQQVAPPKGTGVVQQTGNFIETTHQNGVIPPPSAVQNNGVGSYTTSQMQEFQTVAPPGGSRVMNHVSSGAFQRVGQPIASRAPVGVLSNSDTFQIVSPPKAQEYVSFQTVQPPSADAVVISTMYDYGQDGGLQLEVDRTHDITLSSNSGLFGFKSSPISVMHIAQEESGKFNAGSFSYNEFGGLNIEFHSGTLLEYGPQPLEAIREYLQGGVGPRFGPVQEAFRAQQLLNAYTNLSMNIDSGRNFDGTLNEFHHFFLSPDKQLIISDPQGVIGGESNVTSLIGCSRGHVQAIQMLLDKESEAPGNLSDLFAILRNPTATGEEIERAVDQIVKQWFMQTSSYGEFHRLYGYLMDEVPAKGTEEYKAFIKNLEHNGYYTAGRLVFEFRTGGGQ